MPKDLIPKPIQQINWDEEHLDESLVSVFQHVVQDAKGAIDWYMKARKPKKYGGLIIRGSAVILVAAAGLLPLVAALLKPEGTVPPPAWQNPLVASLFLGVAAALVAFDRFFGFSSAWMRFMTAELNLRNALEEFEIDWYALQAARRGQQPTPEQVVQHLDRCKVFVGKINEIVNNETKVWVEEFTSSLSQVDEAVKAAETAAKARADAAETATKAHADGNKPGALNLQIENIDKITPPWKLAINGGEPIEYNGATAAVNPIPPGKHTIRVFAIVDGKARTAEKVFDVASNTTSDAKITV